MSSEEDELRLSPSDYETIFHNASDGLIVHPPDSGEILDTNERFAEIVGYSRDTLLDLTISDITADDWKPEMPPEERVQQAREEGHITFEWRNQRKDGTPFWAEVNLTPIQLQGEERILSSVRDISARKKQERQVQAIFNQTYQFTGLLETDGTLIEANETALEFGDLDREDVVGKPFWDCYWWQLSEETQQELKQAIRRAVEGEFVRYNVEVQGADRTEIIDFSLRPITTSQGDVTLLIAEGRIITDLWEQRQRLDVYNRVLGHNLRNKLTVIKGFINDVKRGDEAGFDEKYGEHALSASERLENLGEKIREFDQAKQQETTFERVAVGRILDSVIEQFRDPSETERIQTAVDPELVIDTNRTYLRFAVEELIENALDHTDSTVKVSAGYASESPHIVEITVTDEGSGLPEGEFRPVLNENPGGRQHPSGIGLWIAKWSVDELGGTLDFESDSGGTAATIRLPATL